MATLKTYGAIDMKHIDFPTDYDIYDYLSSTDTYLKVGYDDIEEGDFTQYYGSKFIYDEHESIAAGSINQIRQTWYYHDYEEYYNEETEEYEYIAEYHSGGYTITGVKVDFSDLVAASAEESRALVFRGSDRMTGSDEDDHLIGYEGNDKLVGGKGDDTLDGGNGAYSDYFGNDSLFGGWGNDKLLGRYGDDRLEGGDGNDRLDAGSGDDKLLGQGGDDSLSGGRGMDTLVGAAGSDVLNGGLDRDTLSGGGGTGLDIFAFTIDKTDGAISRSDIILDWNPTYDSIDFKTVGTSRNYFETKTTATSVENAFDRYDGVLKNEDMTHLFLYNTTTNTGYLLSDQDGDHMFDTAVTIKDAGSAASLSYLDIV